MQRIYSVVSLILIWLSFSIAYATSRTSLAILPIEITSGVSTEDKQLAENYLYEGLLKSGKFTVLERNKLQSILQEQSFSLTGATQKAIELGKMLHVDKIIIPRMIRQNNSNGISLNVIDVVTGQIEWTTEANDAHADFQTLARVMTSRIEQKYQLIGEILSTADTNYVLDLGTVDKLTVGSRLFVA